MRTGRIVKLKANACRLNFGHREHLSLNVLNALAEFHTFGVARRVLNVALDIEVFAVRLMRDARYSHLCFERHRGRSPRSRWRFG